jgi:PAS domain-containing protein
MLKLHGTSNRLAGYEHSGIVSRCPTVHEGEWNLTDFCKWGAVKCCIAKASKAIESELPRIQATPKPQRAHSIPLAVIDARRPHMIDGGASRLRFEESIPGSRSAPLESILCTEELRLRPFRPPDYETENRALAALASALAESRSNILQTLADTILDVTQCDSSGLSLLTKDDGGKRFYWPAIAGMWKPHIGRGTPRDFGPCGDVLDQNRTLLFQHFERRYPYFEPVTPLVEECLLVPFYVDGRAVGTIWAIMHSDRHKFDAEDERLMRTLGQFASLAYQTLEHIDNLKLQIAARGKAEAEVRELASGLEAKVRCLIDSNIIGIIIWSHDGRISDANETFLRMVGYSRADLVAGQVSWIELTPAEWRSADAQRLAMVKSKGISPPYEKEYFHKAVTACQCWSAARHLTNPEMTVRLSWSI